MKPDGGPRTIRSTIRWSEAEWRQVAFQARRWGLKPSSYIRLRALKDPPVAPRAARAARVRYAEPRSVGKLIRFHPKEWARIERMAKTLKLPPIRFVREAAVGYRVSTRVNEEAIRQLARLGNNLNQMARVANSARQVEHGEALFGVLQDIRATLDRLL